MKSDLSKEIIYQIYIPSFKDENGDGKGDIPGVIANLDYIKNIGSSAVCLRGIYDLFPYSSYEDLLTNPDIKHLIDECHKKELKVILEFNLCQVPNTNRVFLQAIRGDNEKQKYFIFADKDHINNWTNSTNNSMWNQVNENLFYLSTTNKNYVDLNFSLESNIISVKNNLNGFISLGVDGFYLEGLSFIGKKSFASSWKIKRFFTGLDNYFETDDSVALIDTLIRDIDESIILIGHVYPNSTLPQKLKNLKRTIDIYVDERHLLCENYKYNTYLNTKFSIKKFEVSLLSHQNIDEGYALLLNNYAIPRSTGRFSFDDTIYLELSSKMIATYCYFLKGPILLYQGEAVPVSNYHYQFVDEIENKSIDEIYPFLKRYYHYKNKAFLALKKNTVMQSKRLMVWDDNKYGGFSTISPWIKVNENYHIYNAKASLADKSSLFHYYRELFKLKVSEDLSSNDYVYRYNTLNKQILGYIRKHNKTDYLILCNFSDKNEPIPFIINKKNTIVMNNYPSFNNLYLMPYQGVIIKEYK